jgi:predicted nucleic acid-binding protein
MRTLFVDTAYWVAQANPKDNWHPKALELELEIVNSKLITSELVLVEFLNYFSNFGAKMRDRIESNINWTEAIAVTLKSAPNRSSNPAVHLPHPE